MAASTPGLFEQRTSARPAAGSPQSRSWSWSQVGAEALLVARNALSSLVLALTVWTILGDKRSEFAAELRSGKLLALSGTLLERIGELAAAWLAVMLVAGAVILATVIMHRRTAASIR